MKKYLSMLLAVMMLLSCFPAMAAEEPTWKVTSTTGNLKCSNSTKIEGHIEIPAEVDGIKVTGLQYMAFMSNEKITGLTIPDSVRFIDRGALEGMSGMNELILPKNLMVIRTGNIRNFSGIESLVIPPSVLFIRGSIVSCPNLKSVTFEGVCPLFPADDTYKTLHDLHPDCVIYVPNDQLDAYKAAFADDAEVLARIQPSGKNAVVVDWDIPESDFEFDAATGTITKYKGTAGLMNIPATIGGVPVTTIGKQAFTGNHSIHVLNIPEGVETLEWACFSDCDGLVYVKLPTTLKTIEDSVFNSSGNLWDVEWAEGLETIGKGAFGGGPSLWHVTLPTTVRTIGESAFGSAYIKTLTFGPNVESIGKKAFAGNQLTAITYTGTALPQYGELVFDNNKKDATLTLADGTHEETYNAYVAMMAAEFPTCVVNEPVGMVLSFPALDAEAGAAFIGTWNAVAVNDGTDFYGMDLLGISMSFVLNADGTGTVDMGGDVTPGGWYVENGVVIFAPILEEGGQPASEEAMPLPLDENGRMSLDLGGLFVLMEKEGVEYAVPAIPEKPWPELDAEKAKSYVGTWDEVRYFVDGEEISAELMGSTTLILNADGTAQLIEGEEDAYELRWYADAYSAYVGPTMSALAELYFDMNGDLQMKQENSKMIMKPHVDVKVIEGADELLGEWYDDLGNKLTITNDGNMTVTYTSDGWVRGLKWDMVDGVATVTEGLWVGCPIVLENGIVIISGDNAFQLFSVDGDLSAYYGEEELPEAQPIGDEGAAYFGTWTVDMGGLVINLTLNQDGTCATEMFGQSEPGVWSIMDGKADIMGDEAYIDGDGNLVMPSAELVFTKIGGAAPAGPETALGTWGDKYKDLYVNEDGTIELVYKSDGYTSKMTWDVVNGDAIVIDGLWKNMPLTAENGVLTMTDGTYVAEFTRVGDAPAVYVGPGMGAAPAAPAAPVAPAEPGMSAAAAIDYVPSVADDFIGGWICKADPEVQILLLDGEANLIDGGELYTVDWEVVNGVAEFDGMKLYIQENWTTGILDMYGDMVEFERGYVEKPKASAPAASDDDDEMTDEEMLAFLALLAQMAEGEDASNELPEHLMPYVGTWHMVYIATGGWEGDMRAMGVSGKLELNADGTGKLSGAADDSGKWYDDEGTVRFGQAEAPLTLLDGGFLRYGNQLSGYMVFSQDATASWSPAPVVVPTAAPAPAPAATGSFTSYEDYLGIKFVATTYTSGGQVRNASELGAEYSVIFYANGTGDFTMAGIATPGLNWGLQKIAVGLTQIDAFVLTYYTVNYNFIPTETGFDMDFYGTMNLHFVPAE